MKMKHATVRGVISTSYRALPTPNLPHTFFLGVFKVRLRR